MKKITYYEKLVVSIVNKLSILLYICEKNELLAITQRRKNIYLLVVL